MESIDGEFLMVMELFDPATRGMLRDTSLLDTGTALNILRLLEAVSMVTLEGFETELAKRIVKICLLLVVLAYIDLNVVDWLEKHQL